MARSEPAAAQLNGDRLEDGSERHAKRRRCNAQWHAVPDGRKGGLTLATDRCNSLIAVICFALKMLPQTQPQHIFARHTRKRETL